MKRILHVGLLGAIALGLVLALFAMPGASGTAYAIVLPTATRDAQSREANEGIQRLCDIWDCNAILYRWGTLLYVYVEDTPDHYIPAVYFQRDDLLNCAPGAVCLNASFSGPKSQWGLKITRDRKSVV